MNKTIKIYIALLIAVFFLIVAADYNMPKPIDWSPTYSVNDKIPFGLYILDHEIDGFFKNQKVERISTQTPYEFLDSKYKINEDEINYSIQGSMFYVSEHCRMDEKSIEEIFNFVSQGNTAFFSINVVPQQILDSLKLDYRNDISVDKDWAIWLANKKLKQPKLSIIEGISEYYFSKLDTLNTTILGYQGTNEESKNTNFIKVNYKKGTIFLHTQPAVFTNIHLLKGQNHRYTEKILSYIPKGNVYWCFNKNSDTTESDSPFRYILSQPALKWAWYLFLIGLLIFILFNAKRKQRIVPIIDPLPNLTVDFTKTIGNLYYQEGDFTNIIDKKIIYFLEKIRTDYLLDTSKLDAEFVQKLHLKSGKNKTDILNLVQLIIDHRKSPYQSVESNLIKIHNAIEKVIN